MKNKLMYWLNHFSFSDKKDFSSCAKDFDALLTSEIALTCPAPIRNTLTGPATIAALSAEQRVRYHYKTLCVPEDFDNEDLKRQCLRERLAYSSTTPNAFREEEHRKSTCSADTDLNAIIDEAGLKAGKQAPIFRRALTDGLDSYLKTHVGGLELFERLAISYLYEISERGIRQTEFNPSRGTAKTVKTYFRHVYDYLKEVFIDEESLEDDDAVTTRTETYMKSLGEKRRYAEQPIDYALTLLDDAGEIFRPDPALIYKGKPPAQLARSQIINHVTYASILRVLGRCNHSALRFRSILSYSLQYRANLRVGETHFLQMQNLHAEITPQSSTKIPPRITLTVDVRRRGRRRPKTQAGNRAVQVTFDDPTAEEIWVIKELQKLQERSVDRKTYLFLTGDEKRDFRDDEGFSAYLRAVVKWVTQDPDATLHGSGRKTCINSTVLWAFASEPSTPAMRALIDPDRSSPRLLPSTLQPKGTRYLNLPVAIRAQTGHTNFQSTTLGIYTVHQTELYLEHWSRREIPHVSTALARWISQEMDAPTSKPRDELKAIAVENRLRRTPKIFMRTAFKTVARPTALPTQPALASKSARHTGAVNTTTPEEILHVLARGTWPDTSAVTAATPETAAAIETVMSQANIAASDLALPDTHRYTNSQPTPLSAPTPWLSLSREAPVSALTTQLNRFSGCIETFRPGGLWERTYMSQPSYKTPEATPGIVEYFLISNQEDLLRVIDLLNFIGYESNTLCVATRIDSKHLPTLQHLGITPKSILRGTKPLGRDDRVVIELRSQPTKNLRYPCSLFQAGFVMTVFYRVYQPLDTPISSSAS